VRIYDGFLVHSRGDGGAPFQDEGEPLPTPVLLRDDLDEPVLQFETETDLDFLGFPGTAHADQGTLDYGGASGRVWFTGQATIDTDALCGQINTGPQAPVLRAALEALRAWVVEGTAPPTAEPIEVANDQIVRDELGNARGGVRTPAVDAPTTSLTGKGSDASIFCVVFGQSAPLSPEQLRDRYADHDEYVAAVTESADRAVEGGFLLPYDRDDLVEAAAATDVP
jgi:hypothetical protein